MAHWHIRHQSDDEQAIKKSQPNCTENPLLGFWYAPFVKLSVVWGLSDISAKEKNYLVYSRMQKRSLACIWGRWILSVRTKLDSDICNDKYGGCVFSDISHFLLVLNQYLLLDYSFDVFHEVENLGRRCFWKTFSAYFLFVILYFLTLYLSFNTCSKMFGCSVRLQRRSFNSGKVHRHFHEFSNHWLFLKCISHTR